MAATSIQFIQNPPFILDFRKYAKNAHAPTIPLSSRIQGAVFAPFVLLKELLVCMAKAGSQAVSHMGVSFKHIVLNYYGSLRDWNPPADIYLIAFKIVIWLASIVWCFITTTVRLLNQQYQTGSPTDFLSSFASNELDLSHIVTHDLAIDVSRVPADVTINGLLQMFEEINFTRPQAPGYMSPRSRQEGNTTYTAEELKEGLQVFINHVNQRVAFLGTPPAYDTPRLFAFYQQIEDAVRFAIHKSNQDLEAFRATGEDLTSNRYKNLLEDRARIPLMLAIAGKHCGARYMGEAMELYDSANSENSVAGGTLQDALIEILAAKRKEIANKHIQTHLGVDTHHYTKYMSNLGKTLAIPGTANVIEHLSSQLDRPKFLKLFFADYTVDCIHATIQEKVKKSQALREKITDWLKTQPGNWRPAEMASLYEMLQKANLILLSKDLDPTFKPCVALKSLLALAPYLKADPDLDEFLASGKVQLAKMYPKPLERASVKADIKALFTKEQLGEDLMARLTDDQETFHPRLLALQKARDLGNLTQLNADTAMRVVEGKKPLQQALEEQFSQIQANAFIHSLSLEQMKDDGLSQTMLEWVLVSQGILCTQVGG